MPSYASADAFTKGLGYYLGIRRVTERLYRGVCMKPEEFKATIDHFRAKRADIDGLFAKLPRFLLLERRG